MIFNIRKKDNRVIAYGSNSINNESIFSIEYSPTADEIDKLKNGYLGFLYEIEWSNGLVFKKSSFSENIEKKKNIDQLKKDISSATTVTKIKDILNTLLDNI